MRIAFISQPRDAISASGSQSGSVAIVTWELARRLAERHDVTIHAPLRGRRQAIQERGPGNLLVRRTPRAFRALHKALDLGTGILGMRPPYFSSGFFFREYAAAIARQLAHDLPEIIHLQTCAQFVPVLRRAVPAARIVLHAHDEALTRLDDEIIDRRLSMADAVVTCSDYVTRQWRARFPARAACIHTIGNGVDLELFRPASGDDSSAVCPVILYVGRVSPEKGVHILAQAFEAVLKQWPDARLVVVGSAGLLPYNQIMLFEDDPHIAALRTFYGQGLIDRVRKQVLGAHSSYVDAIRRSVSPGTLERIEFKGPLEYKDLPEVYGSARLLVAPSLSAEPFGLPLAEAMACGVPVIASRAGGMAGIVEEGVTGCLVERGDVAALSRAMLSMLGDAAALAGMRRASRLRADATFGWEGVAGRLESIYQIVSQQYERPSIDEPCSEPAGQRGPARLQR